MRGTTLLARFGSYNFHIIDIALILCCIMIPFSGPFRINSASKTSLMIFVFIFLLSLIRTIYLPNFFVRFATLRPAALFVALIVVSILQEPDRRDAAVYCRIFEFFGILFCGFEVLRLIFGPLFLTNREFTGIIVYNTGRPLGAFSALVLTICAVWRLLIAFRADQAANANRNILKYFGFSIFVVLSGQRTTMIAWALASAAAIAFALPRLWKTSPVFTLALVALCTIGAIASFSDNAWNTLIHLNYSSAHADTFSTRTEIWRSLLSVSRDWPLFDKAFGAPVGAELNLRVSGVQRYWENGMHSAYFGPIPLSGYVGAAALTGAVLIGLIGAIGALWGGAKENEFGLTPDEVIVLDVLILIFGISYDWFGFIGIWLVLIAGKWPPLAARRARMSWTDTRIPAP
ncbi:MAG: O-antigen ligase family protein [Caulobacteraceae bacterium]